MKNISVYCDGGCICNPGRMYGSFSVYEGTNRVFESERLEYGEGTNNIAEYMAVISAMEFVGSIAEVTSEELDVTVYMDSKLVVSQLNKEWKVKDTKIFPLFQRALLLKEQLAVKLKWISGDKMKKELGH